MDLLDLVEQVAQETWEDMGGAVPGEVLGYNPDTGRASVQPVVDLHVGGLLIGKPTIPDVPVVQPMAQAGGLYVPVSTGDIVLLIPSGWELDSWKAGGDGTPATRRRFSLADLVAIPVLRRTGWEQVRQAGDGPVLYGTHVYLGGSDATDWVALASKVLTELEEIQAALDDLRIKYNNHMHKDKQNHPWAVAPKDNPAEEVIVSYTADSVASTVVRCK